MSDSAALELLMQRLAQLEAALAERDARIEQLTARVRELEALLRKDSRTSSKPPSSDGPRKPPPRSRRQPSGLEPGKQPGEPGMTLRQVDNPDRVLTHTPVACADCDRSLRRAPVTSVETRQVFDLPEVRLDVTEHRIEHRRCRCGTVTMAVAPAGIGGPVQYGPRVRAIGSYLVGYQHLPYDRACETLSDLLGVHLSAGTLTTIVTRTADALTRPGGFLDVVRDQLAAADVAHFDETTLRVAGTLAWVHSASTDRLSLFHVHASRGRDAIAAGGVLPVFTGIAVHDGFHAYRDYGTAHQLCNAHHLRELAAILDLDDTQTWAQDMIVLLVEINDMTRSARTAGADTIEPRLLTLYRHRYDQIITAGKTANPDPYRHLYNNPHSPPRKHGSHGARSPATNLLARLHGFAGDVLRFAHDLRVPFDNNQAERDIRMVKLRQKISGGLRTWTGAHTFTAIRSYLSTTHKHGINALQALTQLHNGHTWLPTTT